MKKKTVILFAALMLLVMSGCGNEESAEPAADPYAGMVQVDSGYGTLMWAQLYEDVPASTIDKTLFRRDGSFINYTGGDMSALRGIDVSEHQGDIDWQAVAGDGVEFAMIRAGYRGYSQGGLFEDGCFRQNLQGALENGIKVGVYFFSQAVNAEEAEEEAEYLLNIIKDCDIQMPVAFDWETIGFEEARTDDVDGDTVTGCAAAFCEKVKEAGYEPAVYAYRYLAYYSYDLSRLKDYKLWIGAVGDEPDFYYRHDIWQYTVSGSVNGIDGDVDLNLMFIVPEAGEGSGGADGGGSETLSAQEEAP